MEASEFKNKGNRKKFYSYNLYFGVNDKKSNELQETVTNDLKNANHSVLRKMDDIYRQVLYKAQINIQVGERL